MITPFSYHLRTLRLGRGLTNAELATMSRVPTSLISGLQNDRRRVGEYQARKIGVSLGLDGKALEEFVYNAINTCTEKVLKSCVGYPSEVLNCSAKLLQDSGIFPENVQCCLIRDEGVEIVLQDGHRARLRAELVPI